MFGELEDSDIYVNNQNQSFDDNSDAGVLNNNPESEEISDSSPIPPFAPQEQRNQKKGSNLIVLLVAVVMLLAAGVYKFYFSAPKDTAPVDESSQLGDYFYDKAKEANADANTTTENTAVVDVDLSAPADSAQVPAAAQNSEQPGEIKVDATTKEAAKAPALKKEESKVKFGLHKDVVVSVANGGRVDPFMPFVTNTTPVIERGLPKFDVIAPPEYIPEPDPMTENLMTTTISGIMYDKYRPSAIINVNDSDHLVHKGDKVQGYTILDITPDRVVLKYGTNVFRASVGQQVADGVRFNDVSNLSGKFGGAYNTGAKKAIEINK